MSEIKKIAIWRHFGVISKNKIIERTGCSRVLREIFKRRQIPASDFIAILPYGERKPIVCEAWEFYLYLNQRYVTIVPMPFQEKKRLKNATFRIDPNIQDGLRLWTELRAEKMKIGQTRTQNEFILIWE